jgi:dihydrofolate reductase
MPGQLSGQLRAFQLVVAAARNGLGIGKAGQLPWRLPGDMAYFKDLTSRTRDPGLQNAVVMGRKTWDSIPDKFRPLAGRINVVLTRSPPSDENSSAAANAAAGGPPPGTVRGADGVLYSRSLEEALAMLAGEEMAGRVETVFVIGGGQVYAEALKSEQCAAIHLTQVDADYDCDTHFPAIDAKRFRLWSAAPPRVDKASGVAYSFLCYTAAATPPPQAPAAAEEGASAPAASGGAAAALPNLPPGMASRHEEQQVRPRHPFARHTAACRPRKPQGVGLQRGGQPSLSTCPPPSGVDSHRCLALMRRRDATDESRALAPLQYLDLVRELVDEGIYRGDRTGTGTFSKFGCQVGLVAAGAGRRVPPMQELPCSNQAPPPSLSPGARRCAST